MKEIDIVRVMSEGTNHFVRIVPAVGIVALLFVGMSAASTFMVSTLVETASPSNMESIFGFICMNWLISFTVYGISVAVVMRALHGKSGDMFGTFVVSVVKYVIVMAGSMACVVPGIYLMCMFSLAEVLAFRGHGLGSLSMASHKINGNKIAVLIVYIVVVLVGGGLFFVLITAATAFAGEALQGVAAIKNPQYWVFNLMQSAFSAMILSYLYCVLYEIALTLEDGRLSDDMVDVFS